MSASGARTGTPIHVEADGCPGRDRTHPRHGVPRRARRAMGTVPDLSRCRLLDGVLRSIEEQEREVVLDERLRQSRQGPSVPRSSGGGVTTLDLPLRAPGGEPVDLWRTLVSHGFAELSPTDLDEEHRTLAFTVRVPGGRPRRVRISEGAHAATAPPRGPRPAAGPEGRPRGARRGRPRPAARSGPLAVLSPRRGRPRPRVGRCRRGPDASLTDGLRGRREDGLHDELRMERDGAHGRCPRHPPR